MSFDIEKVFRPGRWFVMFCGLLVFVWVSWKIVSKIRLAEDAKYYGQQIYTWTWPGKNYQSQAEIKDAKVIKLDNNEAVVEVNGKQYLAAAGENKKETKTVDCSAVLTMYRVNKGWMLGRVDLK